MVNFFIRFLDLLGVKYTKIYSSKLYNEHPHKYNMFGLSKMLTQYGINNLGIQIINKENSIHTIPPPFIAHIGNDFVTVEKISKYYIAYYWNERKFTIPIKDFLDLWSGAILIAQVDENSIEPDYKQHKNEELVRDIRKLLLFLGGFIMIGIGVYENSIYQNLGISLLLLFNIIGIYIGSLLIFKQISIQSSHAEKICSLFAKSDCNDILESSAAKFMGVIGWSELGFSYFLSNIIILLFIPHFLSYFILINIFALCFSFWSIWYQKFKARTWCPLCLIVQGVFWIIFIISLIFGYVQIPKFTFINIITVGLIYGVPFLIVNLALPYLTEGQKAEKIMQEFNSLKLEENVFRALLKKETFYEVDRLTSNILLGDQEAKNMITVFTNPHCNPCANMHIKIEKLLKDSDNKFCIQYILSSFEDELNSSCEFLLYINKNFSREERDIIYNEWFDKGKLDRERIFKKYNFEPNDNISKEFKEHLDWKMETKLRATPTILFEGYELPDMFFQQIENLVYFSELDINIK